MINPDRFDLAEGRFSSCTRGCWIGSCFITSDINQSRYYHRRMFCQGYEPRILSHGTVAYIWRWLLELALMPMTAVSTIVGVHCFQTSTSHKLNSGKLGNGLCHLHKSSLMKTYWWKHSEVFILRDYLRVRLSADLASERLHSAVYVLMLFQSARSPEGLSAIRAGMGAGTGVGVSDVTL